MQLILLLFLATLLGYLLGRDRAGERIRQSVAEARRRWQNRSSQDEVQKGDEDTEEE